MQFQDFTAVRITMLFWAVTPCRLVEINVSERKLSLSSALKIGSRLL
jgi:hypothetical protein